MNKIPISLYTPSDGPSEDENGKRLKELELSLPREKGYLGPYLYLYQNFWCPSVHLPDLLSLPSRFQPQGTDIILASKPKSGTTWLKALAFSILNRDIFPTSNNQDHPLLSNNPHQLVPYLENTSISVSNVDDHSRRCPRLFATHLPYNALPESIKESGCRIVYIQRNVLDTAVSFWAFSRRAKEVSFEDYFDSICKGVEEFGPYWDHVLGYWEESLRRPNKVLFFKYEDMKANGALEMKKLADFIGCGFSDEEEEGGAIEQISKLCSFRNLKELEVNKKGRCNPYGENKDFFRKGEVGDWINHVSPSMAQRLQKIIQDKFEGSGLNIEASIN